MQTTYLYACITFGSLPCKEVKPGVNPFLFCDNCWGHAFSITSHAERHGTTLLVIIICHGLPSNEESKLFTVVKAIDNKWYKWHHFKVMVPSMAMHKWLQTSKLVQSSYAPSTQANGYALGLLSNTWHLPSGVMLIVKQLAWLSNGNVSIQRVI